MDGCLCEEVTCQTQAASGPSTSAWMPAFGPVSTNTGEDFFLVSCFAFWKAFLLHAVLQVSTESPETFGARVVTVRHGDVSVRNPFSGCVCNVVETASVGSC